jgi:integrase
VAKQKQALQSEQPSIDKYQPVSEFLSSCKSKYTAKGYKTALTKFFAFAAIEKKGFDPDVAIRMKPEELNPLVLKYAMHLKKVAKTTEDYKRGEISVNSYSYYINAIKVFFDYHEILLSWKKIKRFSPERIARKYHVYDVEEIRKLLAVANHRERVIILVLLSSGIRAEALIKLQVRDFEVIENNLGHLVVYARTPSYYHTFCTPEATAAIQFYLSWRKEMGEEIKPESPLIRNSIKDAFAKAAKVAKPISSMRLWEIMQKLLRKASISSENNYSLQPNHAFRKRFNTAVANMKINPLFKEIMLGHSLKLDKTYYNRDDPESLKALLSEYTKAVESLTISPEYQLKKEVVELTEKLRDAPALSVLQNEVLAKSLEMDALKKDFAKKDEEKDKQVQMMGNELSNAVRLVHGLAAVALAKTDAEKAEALKKLASDGLLPTAKID